MLINFNDHHSIFNVFLSEIRDRKIQKDSMRFRKNLERTAEIFAYEISKTLPYEKKEITTPLGISEMRVFTQQPVIASILRAGLPMHEGILNYFDKAENAFISAYRKYRKDGTFQINFEYISSPPIEGKTLIITDPMLATGSSMVLAYKALLKKGTPKHTHIVSLIASKEGIEYFQSHVGSKNISLWVGAIDDELTVKSYIVPGLGDAGDLAYGIKE